MPIAAGGQANLVEPDAKPLRCQASMQAGSAVQVARCVADEQVGVSRPIVCCLGSATAAILYYRHVKMISLTEPRQNTGLCVTAPTLCTRVSHQFKLPLPNILVPTLLIRAPDEWRHRVEMRGSMVGSPTAGIGASFPFPLAPAEVG